MIGALPESWRAKAEGLARFAPAAAEAFREAADELESAITSARSDPLSPEQIASLGLCSAETVRRAVRNGVIENIGTPGKIQVRAGDTAKLPKGRGRKSERSFYGSIARKVARANRSE